jgi:hypothetical protein
VTLGPSYPTRAAKPKGPTEDEEQATSEQEAEDEKT